MLFITGVLRLLMVGVLALFARREASRDVGLNDDIVGTTAGGNGVGCCAVFMELLSDDAPGFDLCKICSNSVICCSWGAPLLEFMLAAIEKTDDEKTWCQTTRQTRTEKTNLSDERVHLSLSRGTPVLRGGFELRGPQLRSRRHERTIFHLPQTIQRSFYSQTR